MSSYTKKAAQVHSCGETAKGLDTARRGGGGDICEPIGEIFFFGATSPIWALAYLHETLRFTSVF
jgi:hypothetical protein